MVAHDGIMERILIVECDTSVRQLIELQVAFLGYSVAESADECDIAVIEPADARGYAAARRLRRDRPDVPLVFTSIRYPTQETIALEPFAHLVKPFGLRRLASALAAACEMDVATCS